MRNNFIKLNKAIENNKVIQIVEAKIKELDKYIHLGETFKARKLILQDVLKDLK